jgi:subfamily B ATP-binding cassette protein HlyB/CyaB
MQPTGELQPPINTGLAALIAMAVMHGVAVDEAQLRHQFGEDDFDTSRILLVAQSLGLTAKAVKQMPDRLDKAPLPAIAQDQSSGLFFIVGKIQIEPETGV